jgi:hypothetical protein
LKTLLSSNIDSNAASFSFIGRFIPVLAGFQNNLQDHRQLHSKQLSKSKAAIGKSGTSFLKRVTGIIFTTNKKSRRTLILDGLHQTIARDCAAHQRPYKMY